MTAAFPRVGESDPGPFCPEPLAPELAACLHQGSLPTLKHPLVFSIPYHPALNGVLNASLAAKRKALAKAIDSGDFRSAIFLHERPYRFSAFTALMGGMSDRDYWGLLGTIYVDSENLHEVDNLRGLMAADRGERHWIMTEEERNALATLPDLVPVWKGVHKGYRWDSDWSFTTSRAVALWFARRFNLPQKTLLQGFVEKQHVAAYFTRRGEAEILADPKRVKISSREPVRG